MGGGASGGSRTGGRLSTPPGGRFENKQATQVQVIKKFILKKFCISINTKIKVSNQLTCENDTSVSMETTVRITVR